MVLEGSGHLFKGGQEVIMTVEETAVQPNIADTEMVLWRKVGGIGEFSHEEQDNSPINSSTKRKGQTFTVGIVDINNISEDIINITLKPNKNAIKPPISGPAALKIINNIFAKPISLPRCFLSPNIVKSRWYPIQNNALPALKIIGTI